MNKQPGEETQTVMCSENSKQRAEDFFKRTHSDFIWKSISTYYTYYFCSFICVKHPEDLIHNTNAVTNNAI